jgi:drug/metabolite transporter (DMT)-like permease
LDNLIGIAAIMIGTGINNFGIFLQKRQVNVLRNSGHEGESIVRYLKNPLWVLGILMQTILCMPFLVFSVGLIGITLAQPLANSGILFLVLCLVFFLGEKMRKSDYLAVAILLSGMVAVGAGGVTGEVTIQSFLSEGKRGVLIAAAVLLSILIALNVFLLKIKRIKRYALGALGGMASAVVSISLQIFTSALSSYRSTGASESAAVFLLILSPVIFISFTGLGILAIQEAFKLGQAVNILPFAQVPLNLIPVLAGIFLFGQSAGRPAVFIYGIVAIMVSASMLARFQEDGNETSR